MNKIIRNEQAVEVFGVKCRAHNVVADDSTGRIRNQKINTVRRQLKNGHTISAELRFDDECNNGHETFSITGTEYSKENSAFAYGCLHEQIAEAFPELAHLIKWHLVSTDGPLHYIANTTYHAGNRDYNGLLKGEKKQIRNGRTGELAWKLAAVDANGNETDLHYLKQNVDGPEAPKAPGTLQYVPWCTIGEGKERDFAAARSCAAWPEATEEELSLPKDELAKLLAARLPKLLDDFKHDITACGFLWPTPVEAAQ